MSTFKSILFLRKSSLGKQVSFPSVPLYSGRCSKFFVFSIGGITTGSWKKEKRRHKTNGESRKGF
ncbi:hypothetical protein NC653_022054 [Populus alba x Populus x berolinensis]|uniref:Uncharacterized protein n=1 Tax=Populus alba x Populus x berolinensis TaxID=444605 RepID=A0AAD6QFD1_9ROSI|nr:hypothetical protein NC653_022054 [Populus alba x Populus x berolinensis]